MYECAEGTATVQPLLTQDAWAVALFGVVVVVGAKLVLEFGQQTLLLRRELL